MPVVLQLVLDALIGYIWGSIPAGYWMGKLLKGKDFDIRAYGSHKIGATNVLRTLGKVPALIVLIFDLSKGVLPTLLATLVPAFIGFRGGRGVMTGAGAILVISPFTFLICAITTLSTIAIWRYVSLGSIVGGLTSIVCGIVFYIIGRLDPTFFAKVTLAQLVMLVVNPALVIIFHYDNIQRLLAGTERKIGQKVELKEQATPTTSTP